MRRHTGQADEAEVNITPMLDIVFIMLIFFIVTATFVKESGITVNKPEAVTTVEVPRITATIAVSRDQEIWINKREVDIREVRAVVERLIRETPQGAIVIEADAESQTGVVVDIVDRLNEIGVSQVAIAAPEKD